VCAGGPWGRAGFQPSPNNGWVVLPEERRAHLERRGERGGCSAQPRGGAVWRIRVAAHAQGPERGATRRDAELRCSGNGGDGVGQPRVVAQRPRRLRLRRAAWADQRQPLQGTDRARRVWRVGEQRESVLSRLRPLKACGKRWRFDWSTSWLLSSLAPSSSHRSTARGGWRAKLGVRAELLWIQRQVQRRRSEQWLRWREENEEQQAAAWRPHADRRTAVDLVLVPTRRWRC